MLGMLTEAGHQIAAAPEAADCLVVNTCAFIDRAREESVNTILELAHLKERGRARALIVTGCLTQRYGVEITQGDPGGQRDPRHLRAAPHRGPGQPGRRPPGVGERRPAGIPLRRADPAPAHRRGCPTPTSRSPRAATWGAPSVRSPSSAASTAAAPLPDIVAEVERARPARHPGGDPGLAGHARLRARPARQRGHRRPAPGAVRHADAVDPADVSPPRPRDRAPHREVAARAGGALPRHAGAARRRRDPARHASRRDRPAHEGHRRAAARRAARASPCAPRCWWAFPARPRPRSRTCSPSSRTWRSTASASSPTRWRRARPPPTCRIRSRPR